MEKKKIKLEDLKIESFLTEIDESKVVRIQGGGEYDSKPGDTDTNPPGCDDDTKQITEVGCPTDDGCPTVDGDTCGGMCDTDFACPTMPPEDTCDASCVLSSTWP